jgi:hypothetical protein
MLIFCSEKQPNEQAPRRPRRQIRTPAQALEGELSAKERRLLEQALAISRVEQKNLTRQISEFIEPMPVFHPSEEEFQNPIEYVEKLITSNEKIAQYGCVKIVPPSSFKPPLAFDTESARKLPTRY